MKVKPETLDRMAIAMRAVMNHLFTKEKVERLPVGGLFDWWMLAFQHATYKHDDKRFTPPVSFVKSLYRDETLPLYPDDTNDDTLHTALKKVRDMIVNSFDDFVMVCFPNITKELCGVSYYKFNHSKAFIYYNGVEVEVSRKDLTSRDPHVLAQLAILHSSPVLTKDLSEHPKMPIELNQNDLILQSAKSFYEKFSETGVTS